MIGCIIQARMGSSRLPGKVLMKSDDARPLLYYVINQLRYCTKVKNLVIATTTNQEDDEIEKFANNNSINIFRGKEKDVLDRYFQCAKKHSFSTIVRITADCPLIDPQIVDNVIEKFFSGSYDYATNTLIRTFPIGTDVEVFSFSALERTWKHAPKQTAIDNRRKVLCIGNALTDLLFLCMWPQANQKQKKRNGNSHVYEWT